MIGKRGEGRKWIIIVAVGFVVLLAILIFFSFIYVKKVDNQGDFKQQLYNCDRTFYLSDQENAVWQYKILGEEDGVCKVEVSLISVKEGIADIKKLEGESMICGMPLGSTSGPESNLKFCHGILKEGIQEIIIEKMHTYVTSNLNDIASVL